MQFRLRGECFSVHFLQCDQAAVKRRYPSFFKGCDISWPFNKLCWWNYCANSSMRCVAKVSQHHRVEISQQCHRWTTFPHACFSLNRNITLRKIRSRLAFILRLTRKICLVTSAFETLSNLSLGDGLQHMFIIIFYAVCLKPKNVLTFFSSSSRWLPEMFMSLRVWAHLFGVKEGNFKNKQRCVWICRAFGVNNFFLARVTSSSERTQPRCTNEMLLKIN